MLAELGFRYDSSISPARMRHYGWRKFPPGIHRMTLPNGATIVEAPMSVVRVLGKTLPACGGGYMRHFPYSCTRWTMKRIQRVRPAVVYIHPYEIDTDPPPEDFQAALAAAPKKTRNFHRLQLRNRKTWKTKLTRLLDEFRFAPLKDVIASQLGL